MPERTTSGNNWRKIDKMLDPKSNMLFMPMLVTSPGYSAAQRLLHQKVKQTSGLTHSKTFEFTAKQLEDIADAFDTLARITTSQGPQARSVARFFRTGDLDRRIA